MENIKEKSSCFHELSLLTTVDLFFEPGLGVVSLLEHPSPSSVIRQDHYSADKGGNNDLRDPEPNLPALFDLLVRHDTLLKTYLNRSIKDPVNIAIAILG